MEKRRENRFGTEGEVSFTFQDPLPHVFTGQLMDYSKSGFRALHSYAALVSGQVVSFHHVLAGGEARVVWNRIMEGRTETGFVVLKLRPNS